MAVVLKSVDYMDIYIALLWNVSGSLIQIGTNWHLRRERFETTSLQDVAHSDIYQVAKRTVHLPCHIIATVLSRLSLYFIPIFYNTMFNILRIHYLLTFSDCRHTLHIDSHNLRKDISKATNSIYNNSCIYRNTEKIRNYYIDKKVYISKYCLRLVISLKGGRVLLHVHCRDNKAKNIQPATGDRDTITAQSITLSWVTFTKERQ
jgi:hypothetical protein